MTREFQIDLRIKELIGNLVDRGFTPEEKAEYASLCRLRVLRMTPRLKGMNFACAGRRHRPNL